MVSDPLALTPESDSDMPASLRPPESEQVHVGRAECFVVLARCHFQARAISDGDLAPVVGDEPLHPEAVCGR